MSVPTWCDVCADVVPHPQMMQFRAEAESRRIEMEQTARRAEEAALQVLWVVLFL
jgi:hypothetical protein